jgi:hypothetical protein
MSWINNAPVPIVLIIDTPTQIEQSFISEKNMSLGVKKTVTRCPQKPVTRIRSSLAIALFNYLNLYCFIRPWLAQLSP